MDDCKDNRIFIVFQNLSNKVQKQDRLSKKSTCIIHASAFLWSHQGLNLGPPDYESGATNQLSYRTNLYYFALWLGVVPNHNANIILFSIYSIS